MGLAVESPLRALHPKRVFYGWWLVSLSVFLSGIAFGPLLFGAGILIVALKREFGWSQSVLALPWTLNRAVEGAILGPVDGWLTDRLGARRIVIIGMFILGIGLVGFSLIKTVPAYLVTVAIMWLGAGLALGIPLTTALNSWFIRRRTIAMALAQMGGNIGGLLVPLLAASVEAFGWRASMLWAGIGTIAVAFPVGMLVRNTPEEYGQRPDGDPPVTSTRHTSASSSAFQSAPAREEVNFTTREALKTSAFWLISASMACAVAPALTVIFYVPSSLDVQGIPLEVAGMVVATYTITGAVSRLVAGFTGDRFPKHYGIALFVAIQAVGVLVVALVPGLVGAYIFAVLFGIGLGGRGPLFNAIRGDYYGRKNFATITGISSLAPSIAFAIPIAVGWWSDRTGSYTLPFLLLGLVNLVGAVPALFATRPQPPVRSTVTATP